MIVSHFVVFLFLHFKRGICKNLGSNVLKYEDNCIPVLGLGVITDYYNFLPRLINSIDYCVDNFVIVSTEYANTSLLHPVMEMNKFIGNYKVISKERFLFSVSEGWNIILKEYPRSRWFMIVAYDIYFLPGQLEKMARRFCDQSGLHIPTNDNSSILLSFSNWVNADVVDCAYNMFALLPEVISSVGYFDENLFPVRDC